MAIGKRWSWGHPAMTGMAPMAAASYIRKQSRVLPPLPTGTNLYIHGIITQEKFEMTYSGTFFHNTCCLMFSVKLWLLLSLPHSYLLPLLLPLLSLSLIKKKERINANHYNCNQQQLQFRIITPIGIANTTQRTHCMAPRNKVMSVPALLVNLWHLGRIRLCIVVWCQVFKYLQHGFSISPGRHIAFTMNNIMYFENE